MATLNVVTFQNRVLAVAGEHRVCLPGAAHGSAFRSQNKVLRLLRFCPLRPNLYRSGPDVRPEPRHKPCAARPMPRPRIRCGIGTQKAPRGQASNVDRTKSVRREKRQMPRWGFQGMSGSGARAGQGMARIMRLRQARKGQDEQVMELVRNDSYYYYTIREGVKSRGVQFSMCIPST